MCAGDSAEALHVEERSIRILKCAHSSTFMALQISLQARRRAEAMNVVRSDCARYRRTHTQSLVKQPIVSARFETC